MGVEGGDGKTHHWVLLFYPFEGLKGNDGHLYGHLKVVAQRPDEKEKNTLGLLCC